MGFPGGAILGGITVPVAPVVAVLILFVSSTKSTTAANVIYLQARAHVCLVFLGPRGRLREQGRRMDDPPAPSTPIEDRSVLPGLKM